MKKIIAGVDEVGRGALAGPVVSAAVVLPASYHDDLVTDSKKLSPRKREKADRLIRNNALAWSIGAAGVGEIDEHNIHHATLIAMRRAVLGLRLIPDFVIVDGRFLPELPYPGKAQVQADVTESNVSAASILAKVFRDHYMLFLKRQYPQYGFCRHKGYPTAMHLEALRNFGPCPEHRRSFSPVAQTLGPRAQNEPELRESY